MVAFFFEKKLRNCLSETYIRQFLFAIVKRIVLFIQQAYPKHIKLNFQLF
jgi:hypothetical protein